MELICSRVQLDAGMASARLLEFAADSSFLVVLVPQCFSMRCNSRETHSVHRMWCEPMTDDTKMCQIGCEYDTYGCRMTHVSINLLLCAHYDHLNCVNVISFSISISNESWRKRKKTKKKRFFFSRGNIKVLCERHRHWSHHSCSNMTFINALVLMPLLWAMYWHNFFFFFSWRRAYFHAFNIYTVWVLSNVCTMRHSISQAKRKQFLCTNQTRSPMWNETNETPTQSIIKIVSEF